jgi:pimeloyl-ACP methyl ester carboxylesterase
MTLVLSVIGGVLALILLGLAGLALFAALTARQVEKILPPLGRFVDVGGTRIHYLDEGAGPAIVLVHGLGGQMRNFTYALLDRLKSEFRVIVLDRPGSGYSASIATPTPSANASVIAQLLETLEIERPLVVGHSLGGAIALTLASRYPARVGGLALIAPVTTLPDHVAKPFQGLQIASAAVRQLIAWTLAIPISIRNGPVTLEALFGPEPAPADFPMKGGGLLSLRPKSFVTASRDLVASPEDLTGLPELYSTLKMPVGTIYGTGDRILDQKAHCDALAAKVAGVDLELIEDGGHMILVTCADRCAEFIKRMAQKVATVPKSATIA